MPNKTYSFFLIVISPILIIFSWSLMQGIGVAREENHQPVIMLEKMEKNKSSYTIPLQTDIIVTTSIQAAIDSAQAGDTIIIPAGIYTESLTLTEPISLTGISSTTTIINALENQRVLTITGESIDNSVVISGITFKGGNQSGSYPADRGGGILVFDGANPLLKNIMVIESYATLGGGLCIDWNSSATLTNVKVMTNTAENDGGGIYSVGNMKISNSGFISNSLTSVFGAEGGGIFNLFSSEISNSYFDDNEATFGAGIYNRGTLTINDSLFSNNIAGSVGGAIHDQGGLSVISSTTFLNNSTPNPSGRGAAIYMTQGTVQVNNSTLFNNSSNGSGGAISNFQAELVINDSLISGNQAMQSGGSIDISSGSMEVNNTKFYSNTADRGGAMVVGGVVTITNSTLHSNTVTLSGSSRGGGIYQTNGSLTIMNSSFYSNTASSQGGGIFQSGSLVINNSTISGSDSHNGGGIYSFGGTTTLENVSITTNHATFGGGIFHNGGTVNLKNTILAGNSGPFGPDCYGTITSQGYNLIQDTTDCIISGDLTDNLIGVNPGLSSIDYNNGSTLSHALTNDSPAIDAGSCSGATSDQRGFSRPYDILSISNVDDGCDIGAYEYHLSSSYLPLAVK